MCGAPSNEFFFEHREREQVEAMSPSGGNRVGSAAKRGLCLQLHFLSFSLQTMRFLNKRKHGELLSQLFFQNNISVSIQIWDKTSLQYFNKKID